jgi:tetratricopeptide (TPR) repeat protein
VTVPAAAGALAAAAAHATVEFALHAPLYAVVLASLVGLALRHFPADAASATRAAPRLPWIPAVSLLIALILTPLAKRMETMDSGEALSRLDSREAGRAMIWAPTSWFAWFEMGKQAAALATPDGIRFAERCITQAGEYDPKNYRLWKYLGELRLALGNRAGARDAFKRVHELRSWVNIPVVPEDRP